jgi:proteasome lid subunit RPN8/RPN11
MKVLVSEEILAQIRKHGEEIYPHECCGFMLGSARDGEQRITEIRSQRNERTESRENRFVISPEQFKAEENYARKAGVQLVGIYHSHPDSPARPSDYDREHAWPWFSYLIVSVVGGKAMEAQAWQLREDRSGFDSMVLASAATAAKGDKG